MKALKGFSALVVVAIVALFATMGKPQQTGGGQGASSGGSGTVSPNNGIAGEQAFYAAAGGSTTVGPDATLIDNGAALTYSGTTGIVAPAGTGTAPAYAFTGALTTGPSLAAANVLGLTSNGALVAQVTGGLQITDNGSYKFSQTAAATGTTGASIGVVGTGGTEAIQVSGNSTNQFLHPGACKVIAVANMTSTGVPVTFCSFTLPNSAQTWAWQCSGTYSVSTASDTFTLGYTAAQAPTGVTGNAIIYTVASPAASSAGSVTSTVSTANQSMLQGGSVSTVTNMPFTSSGVIQASATSGTFVLTGMLTGTTPSGSINPGTTCFLY